MDNRRLRLYGLLIIFLCFDFALQSCVKSFCYGCFVFVKDQLLKRCAFIQYCEEFYLLQLNSPAMFVFQATRLYARKRVV